MAVGEWGDRGLGDGQLFEALSVLCVFFFSCVLKEIGSFLN